VIFLLFSLIAFAAEKSLPYLGPGAEALSKEEYERIYKSYIQSSVLLGYPFLQNYPQACDQALSATFRQAGMFAYPVPGDAAGVLKSNKTMGGKKVESYELGGSLLQLSRATNGAPERLLWINSSSPKANRQLAQKMKSELLTLEKDKVTGLERVKGLPVGLPHPYLNPNGQGLIVRILRFNGKVEGCAPMEFFDNAWTNGFELSESRCQELQGDAQKVWTAEISPEAFRARELDRMKAQALAEAKKNGASEQDAKKLVEKHFVPPFTNEINIVGAAMRNLAQCNLVALGGPKKRANDASQGGGGKPTMEAPDASGAAK
jgi:hypothetical protein